MTLQISLFTNGLLAKSYKTIYRLLPNINKQYLVDSFTEIYLLSAPVSLLVLLRINSRPICIAAFRIFAASITLSGGGLVLCIVVVFREEEKSVRSAGEACQVLALKSRLNHVPDRFHFRFDHFGRGDG